MSIYILGISAFYHDSAACLLKDGRIIAAAQEERFTRLKHDASFPSHAIDYCLKEAGIGINDIAYIAFYEKPLLKFHRLLTTYWHYAPKGLFSFVQAMTTWLGGKLYVKSFIRSQLRFKGKIFFPEHHAAHAASAFYPSPYEEAAILTIDGVGEWATASLSLGQGASVHLLKEIRFPHSLGLLYSAFTFYAGFRVNSGEYKLMGLAPYGEPKYVELIKKHLIDIKDDGSFWLNMDYFDYCVGESMTNERFHQLFGGPPRAPESAITQKDMDIARSIQVVTEEIMLKMANHAYEVTGKENLCLAGGVALNCVGNGRIARESKFKNIWIQPAAGDAGGALGAAFYVWHQALKKDRVRDNINDHQQGSYLGPDYAQEIKEFVQQKKLVCDHLDDAALAAQVAQLIVDGNVIGLFHGRMEFGPRALGGRSIIGDPRSEQMQSIMNLKIKFRESFRPFAPSVLREQMSSYFELNASSPYMLLVAPVKKDKMLNPTENKGNGLDRLKVKRSVVPAITHVDYSARLHSVEQKTNPFFYDVINQFYRLTGCPMIINTSYNVRGEPIVNTPEDAYRCFMCTNIDYLVLGNYLFAKAKQHNAGEYKLEQISRVMD